MPTRRALASSSNAAATALHSASQIALQGGSATLVLFKKSANVSAADFRTLWATETGKFQVYNDRRAGPGAHQLLARIDGSNATSATDDLLPDTYGHVTVHMGLNHAAGGIDIEVLVNGVSQATVSSATAGSELFTAGIHWVLGDDNSGGTNTDAGWAGKVYDLALLEGIFDTAQLNYDTTTGDWQDLSPAAKAALVYRLDGQNLGDPGQDSSGNANDFLVENGGVTLDEADVPQGANPSETTPAITGALEVTEPFGDSFASDGSVAGLLSIAASGPRDWVDGTGQVALDGVGAAMGPGGDLASASGAVAGQGDLVATGSGDMATLSATAETIGEAAAREDRRDSLAGTLSTGNQRSANLSATDASDRASADGAVVAGGGALIDEGAPDRLSGAGQISGTAEVFTAEDAIDTATATASARPALRLIAQGRSDAVSGSGTVDARANLIATETAIDILFAEERIDRPLIETGDRRRTVPARPHHLLVPPETRARSVPARSRTATIRAI